MSPFASFSCVTSSSPLNAACYNMPTSILLLPSFGAVYDTPPPLSSPCLCGALEGPWNDFSWRLNASCRLSIAQNAALATRSTLFLLLFFFPEVLDRYLIVSMVVAFAWALVVACRIDFSLDDKLRGE